MIKIIHERWKCIGCGSCVSVDPSRWTMADDNFVDLNGSTHHKVPEGLREELNVKELGKSKEAEEICPVNCIHVTQE